MGSKDQVGLLKEPALYCNLTVGDQLFDVVALLKLVVPEDIGKRWAGRLTHYRSISGLANTRSTDRFTISRSSS